MAENKDAEVDEQVARLQALYEQVGEDPKVGQRAINEMLASGPGAAARLRATADAVAASHKLEG